MNLTETSKLLTVASGFDRREVTEVTVAAWQLALADVPYEACVQAVTRHFTDPATRHAYLEVGHVLDRLEAGQRTRLHEVLADVRSAKARRLIDAGWPRDRPLPADVAARLASVRRAARAGAELEAGR